MMSRARILKPPGLGILSNKSINLASILLYLNGLSEPRTHNFIKQLIPDPVSEYFTNMN